MPYIYRDIDNNITGYSKWQNTQDQEFLAEDNQEFLDFINSVVVPTEISLMQAKLALLGIGKLQDIEDVIVTMTGVEGDAARIAWGCAQSVKRDHPLVTTLIPSLGLTEAEIDDLFITGSEL